MDGLSDHNSFSEVELKELGTLPSSTNGHNPDDNLIEPSDPEVEVETRQPGRRKKVSLKTVGTAITAFLGVPEERNPTNYDPSGPRVRVVMKPEINRSFLAHVFLIYTKAALSNPVAIRHMWRQAF